MTSAISWPNCVLRAARIAILDRSKIHWNSMHRLWRRALEPGDWNNSTSTLNSNLLTNWQIPATISQRVNFRQCYIANAKWMAFAKVAIFYVVNGAVLELQFARKSYVCNYIAILSAQKCWHFERGVFTHHYWWFAFVFQIVALGYWCLRVSLSSGVFAKLIRAVSVRRHLAEKQVFGNTSHYQSIILFQTSSCTLQLPH